MLSQPLTTHVPKIEPLLPDEADLLARAGQWLDAHRASFIADLLAWIAVPSVLEPGAASPAAPYGPQIARAFDLAAHTAEGYGLRSHDHEGHCLSLTRPEDAHKPQEIALISHLDVVPAGENWSFAPFAPFERDGYIVGRGASDNKGPALLNLYLMRALPDLGLDLACRLRVLYGGAEETGMSDLAHYARQYPLPDIALVTDGAFPVNIAQKGHLVLGAVLPCNQDLGGLSCGSASNVVPDQADLDLVLSPDRWAAWLADCPADVALRLARSDSGTLTARGIAGHAAVPGGTLNALAILSRTLIALDVLEPQSRVAAALLADLSCQFDGAALGLQAADQVTGALTLNIGLVRPHPAGLWLEIDIRYPTTITSSEIVSRLRTRFQKAGARLEIQRDMKPVLFTPDHPAVALLQQTIDSIMDVHCPPYATGGSTHSKVLPNAITFGPSLGSRVKTVFGRDVTQRPDFVPEGHGAPHGADEFVSLANLRDAFCIYAVTLKRLDRWLSSGRA